MVYSRKSRKAKRGGEATSAVNSGVPVYNLPTFIKDRTKNPFIFSFVRKIGEPSYPVESKFTLRPSEWEEVAYNAYKEFLKQKMCDLSSSLELKKDKVCNKIFQWKPEETVEIFTSLKTPDSIPITVMQPSWDRNLNKAMYIVDDVTNFLKMKDDDQIDLIRAAADKWNPPIKMPRVRVNDNGTGRPLNYTYRAPVSTSTTSNYNPQTHRHNDFLPMSLRERAKAKAKAANNIEPGSPSTKAANNSTKVQANAATKSNNTREPGSPDARGNNSTWANVTKPTKANAPLEPTPINSTKAENMNIDAWWETIKNGRSRSRGVTSEDTANNLQKERETSKKQAATNNNAKIKTQAIANAKAIENAKAKVKADADAKAYRSQTSPPPPPPIKKPNGGRRKTRRIRRIRKTRRSCRK